MASTSRAPRQPSQRPGRGFYEAIPGQLYWSGTPTPSLVRELGVDLVVSVSTGGLNVPSARGLDWPHYVAYAHFPIPDGKAVDVLNTDRAVHLVLAYLRDGHKVLVHCLAGRTRSALVVALVVCSLMGWSGQDALEWVRSIRPGAVANPVFEDYLISYT